MSLSLLSAPRPDPKYSPSRLLVSQKDSYRTRLARASNYRINTASCPILPSRLFGETIWGRRGCPPLAARRDQGIVGVQLPMPGRTQAGGNSSLPLPAPRRVSRCRFPEAVTAPTLQRRSQAGAALLVTITLSSQIKRVRTGSLDDRYIGAAGHAVLRPGRSRLVLGLSDLAGQSFRGLALFRPSVTMPS